MVMVDFKMKYAMKYIRKVSITKNVAGMSMLGEVIR